MKKMIQIVQKDGGREDGKGNGAREDVKCHDPLLGRDLRIKWNQTSPARLAQALEEQIYYPTIQMQKLNRQYKLKQDLYIKI